MRWTLALLLSAMAPSAWAATGPNPMHPPFRVLDASGRPITESGAAPSVTRTCDGCHDAAYIASHSSHTRGERKAECVACHFDGGRLPTEPASFEADGTLKRDALRVGAPTDQSCASCHGIVHTGATPLTIPDDFESPAPRHTYALTLETGTVFSGQDVSASWLNLADKAGRTYPWDVHARRLVGCTDCHFARNDPSRADVRQTTLDFLVHDPRHIPLSTFLRRPDHDLAAATCRSCHDPSEAHGFLPYAERHLAVLDCRACHVPVVAGPAAQAIDSTVVLPGGGPRVEYRGMTRAEGEPLNSALIEGFTPFLLPVRDPVEGAKLAPFNVVARWYWASASGEEVPHSVVRAAWLGDGGYAPALLSALDGDGDGSLSEAELRLDVTAKVEAVRARLVALGVESPAIRATLDAHRIHHGVAAGRAVRRDCESCHSGDSALGATIALASFSPGGVTPAPPDDGPLAGATLRSGPDGLFLEHDAGDAVYVFGHSRHALADLIGLLLLGGVVVGVSLHALLRYRTRHRAGHGLEGRLRRVYMYSTYERVWHWLMAGSVVVLLVSGIAVHTGGQLGLPALPVAVRLHESFAVVMMVNAFLALFYHLASSAIRQLVPERRGLVGQVTAQARYYLVDIFRGGPHPTPKSLDRKLNPLQQLTYLGLLNVLFPHQIGTGILIWGVSRWPDFAASIGGLTVVAPLHVLGSWLLLSFFVMHVYLTTTGRTVLSNVRAMVDGWEEVEGDDVTHLHCVRCGEPQERAAQGGSR